MKTQGHRTKPNSKSLTIKGDIRRMSNKLDKTDDNNYPRETIGYLDQYFPKGSKKRGEAMAILVNAFLEGKEVGRKENQVCDICKKPNPFIQRECPSCYLKGFTMELKKAKEEIKELKKLNLKLNKTLKLHSNGYYKLDLNKK